MPLDLFLRVAGGSHGRGDGTVRREKLVMAVGLGNSDCIPAEGVCPDLGAGGQADSEQVVQVPGGDEPLAASRDDREDGAGPVSLQIWFPSGPSGDWTEGRVESVGQ